ncbi:MAG: sulfur carrier protein ThiS [Gemmataceae bacterium]
MIDINLNGEPRQIPAATTVSGLLELLKVSPKQVAVEVNQRVVPRIEHGTVTIQPGDAIEIVTFVQGG